jgi:hypothetical protein
MFAKYSASIQKYTFSHCRWPCGYIASLNHRYVVISRWFSPLLTEHFGALLATDGFASRRGVPSIEFRLTVCAVFACGFTLLRWRHVLPLSQSSRGSCGHVMIHVRSVTQLTYYRPLQAWDAENKSLLQGRVRVVISLGVYLCILLLRRGGSWPNGIFSVTASNLPLAALKTNVGICNVTTSRKQLLLWFMQLFRSRLKSK